MDRKFSAKNQNLKDFFMFILGGFGVSFFEWIQPFIANCNSLIFSCVCMIIMFQLINSIFKSTL